MRKVVITSLIAAMLVVFSAGGFWSGTGAAGTGKDASVSYTRISETDNTPKYRGDEPVVRAHPRGLP